MDTLARALLVAAALVAIAWFAVSYRNTQLTGDAFDVAATPDVPPERIEHALDLVDRTELLNPDRGEIMRLRATLQARAGRHEDAVATVERYTREEPENSNAWVFLANLTRTSDPERSREALARWRELDPVGERR